MKRNGAKRLIIVAIAGALTCGTTACGAKVDTTKLVNLVTSEDIENERANSITEDVLTGKEVKNTSLNVESVNQLYENKSDKGGKYMVYVQTDDKLERQYRIDTSVVLYGSKNADSITVSIKQHDDKLELANKLEVNDYKINWGREDKVDSVSVTGIISIGDEQDVTVYMNLYNSKCTSPIIEKKYDTEEITDDMIVKELKNVFEHISCVAEITNKTVYTDESRDISIGNTDSKKVDSTDENSEEVQRFDDSELDLIDDEPEEKVSRDKTDRDNSERDEVDRNEN